MKSYIKSLRAPFLAGSIVPVLIGAATAFSAGAFSFPLLLVTAAGVAALHLAANLLNDYYDAGGSDPINFRITPFSGGSRVIQDGAVSRWAVLLMSAIFFLRHSGRYMACLSGKAPCDSNRPPGPFCRLGLFGASS